MSTMAERGIGNPGNADYTDRAEIMGRDQSEKSVVKATDVIKIPADILVAAEQRDEVTRDQLERHERERLVHFPPVKVGGVTFRHPELGKKIQRVGHTAAGLSEVMSFLDKKGTFKLQTRDREHLPLHNGARGGVDYIHVPIVTINATETRVEGEMDRQVWTRDMARCGDSEYDIWRLNPTRFRQEGKMARKIFESTMHLMSTDDQLERFHNIIANPKLAKDPDKWPQIAIHVENLGSDKKTKWRHAQDAWQMLGIKLIKAFETFPDPNKPTEKHRLIDPRELTAANKEFLSLMAPFLEAVDFTTVKSSGTWEENGAPKASVIGVEVALLHKMQQQLSDPETAAEYAFLRGDMDPEAHDQMLGRLIDKGLQVLSNKLPDETGEVDPNSFEYRTADATLVYLLEYGIPQLLADRKIPMKANGGKPMTVEQIEDMILDQIRKLYDPNTHGIVRYGVAGDPQRDSYLGPDFNTDKTKLYVDGVKAYVNEQANGGEIDLDLKARLRQEVVPEGPPAAWTHPNAQVSTWASKRLLETGNKERYFPIAMEFLDYNLACITGPGDYHALWNGEQHEVVQAEEAQAPEAWSYRKAKDGTWFAIVSPHNPLNWAKLETKRALVYGIEAAKLANASGEHEVYIAEAA